MDYARLKDFTLKGFAQVCPYCGACLRKTSAVAMFNGERDSMNDGSARRRREWRLLCFLRHEEMAVRMALARATHHAVQRHQCTQTVTLPLAATYAATALSPVIEFVVPALAITYAAPVPVIEYVSPAPVIEYIAPAPAVTYAAPSRQLPLAYTTTTVTTGVNIDITGLVNPPAFFHYYCGCFLRHRSLVRFFP